MKIAAHTNDTDKNSHAAVYIRYGVVGGLGLGVLLNQLPGCYIRRYGEESDQVYGVTAHELAHWSHWQLDKNTFVGLASDAYLSGIDNNEAVIESWAEGVEWQFGMGRYRDLFNNLDYNYNGSNQWKRITNPDSNIDLIYTSLVIDLTDDCNQRITACSSEFPFRSGSFYPNDRVSEYTLQQIEQALRGSGSWNAWRNNIRNMHANNTEVFLDELFSNWY